MMFTREYCDGQDMAPLPHRNMRHLWLRYQIEKYTEGIDLAVRLRMVYTGEDGQMSDTEMGLDVADILCFQLGGSERIVPDKRDLRDYWIEISSDQDFLGPAPSYVHIKNPVRRLCHRMIACTISGRRQGAKKVTGVDLFYLRSMDRGTTNVPYLLAQYLFRHAEGRKSGARLSGGHFIGRLADHFGLVSDEGLRAPGPERQPVVVADAPEADEDAPDAAEGAQADPAPAQAPPPPPLVPQPRTMSEKYGTKHGAAGLWYCGKLGKTYTMLGCEQREVEDD
ncbi:hypothetical protein Tco_0928588 [Tanacetum coccineum]